MRFSETQKGWLYMAAAHLPASPVAGVEIERKKIHGEHGKRLAKSREVREYPERVT
jgi:hypothetical protein